MQILSGITQSNFDAFREGLATFGWVEGRNLRIDYRFAGDPSRLAADAEELVNLRSDAIFALGGPAARAVQQHTSVIPIVPVGGGDLVTSGLVRNIARVFMTDRGDLIVSLAARHRIPAVFGSAFSVARAGGLLSYGPDNADISRSAAHYVDRILRGTKPADLPVQFPAKFHMTLNAKTAEALGLTIPTNLLVRVDEVIE